MTLFHPSKISPSQLVARGVLRTARVELGEGKHRSPVEFPATSPPLGVRSPPSPRPPWETQHTEKKALTSGSIFDLAYPMMRMPSGRKPFWKRPNKAGKVCWSHTHTSDRKPQCQFASVIIESLLKKGLGCPPARAAFLQYESGRDAEIKRGCVMPERSSQSPFPARARVAGPRWMALIETKGRAC